MNKWLSIQHCAGGSICIYSCRWTVALFCLFNLMLFKVVALGQSTKEVDAYDYRAALTIGELRSSVEPYTPNAVISIEIPLGPKYIEGLGAGDLDGDGMDELILLSNYDGATQVGTLHVFTYNDSSFQQLWESPEIEGYPYGLKIVDVDQDSSIDVMAAWNGLQFYRNIDGNLMLQSPLIEKTPDEIFLFSDLDGDSLPDLGIGGPGFDSGFITLYRNDSTGFSFTEMGELPGVPGSNMVLPLNTNADSYVDILGAELYSGSVRVYANNGAFSFSEVFVHTFDSRIFSIAVADFDEDGADDFIVTQHNSKINFFRNEGDTYQIRYTGSEIGSTFNTRAVDIDKDGDQDLIAAAFDGAVYLYVNGGNFTFEEQRLQTRARGNGGLAVGDFDGDEALDIAFGIDPIIVVLDAGSYFVGPMTYTVTNTNDSGPGSLRQAILDANATQARDSIAFDIQGVGPHSIQPTSQLATITDPVVIDGTTEPDFAGNPIVELDGSNAGSTASGFLITAGNSTIRGLVINRFANDGIRLEDNDRNVIEGNFIGTDISGSADLGNKNGILIQFVSSYNRIGGPEPASRNIISGNDFAGINIFGGTGHLIQGNYIGTDATGTDIIKNNVVGITLQNGVTNSTVGGSITGAGNLISGNGNGNEGGVTLIRDSQNNLVQGNLIGTDKTGTESLGNNGPGVAILVASNNVIGGIAGNTRNIISGNLAEGIYIEGNSVNAGGAAGNLIQGNYIGTDISGASALPNGGGGVLVHAHDNTVGGGYPGASNVISGNTLDGVSLDGAANNKVQGNFIGTDLTGQKPLANGLNGVALADAATNILGGSELGAGNVISGNNRNGIFMSEGSKENVIQGNFIGTDSTSTIDVGNRLHGVLMQDASNDNMIGGVSDAAGNTIASNDFDGVHISTGTGNSILSNVIFNNGALGINLGGDGVTANDINDGDVGPNNYQNFPEIAVIGINDDGDLISTYSISSDPNNSAYPLTIQFFTADSSGEGMKFLGSDNYTVTDFNNDGKSANLGNALGLEISIGDSVVATTMDSDGNSSEFSGIYHTESLVTGIAELSESLPVVFRLHQNYPNPFNPETTITFALPRDEDVTILIYNVIGEEVRKLVSRHYRAGKYQVNWDGRDNSGKQLASGVYVAHIEAGGFVRARKMTLLR